MMIVNPGTGSVPGASLDKAENNVSRFVLELLERLASTGSSHEVPRSAVSTSRLPDYDKDGRFAFAVTVPVPGTDGFVLTLLMPGLPLERVNFGARPGDRGEDFPRLYLDGNSYWWEYALVVAAGQVDERLRAQAETAKPPQQDASSARRLGWGYNQGLPDAPVRAAWGCRAILHGGTVDIPPDRKSTHGDRGPVRALVGQLTGGLGNKWRERVAELVAAGEMDPNKDQEFVLVYEAGVTVKANTMGSGQYLHVCAYYS